jgi:hypothetical protein
VFFLKISLSRRNIVQGNEVSTENIRKKTFGSVHAVICKKFLQNLIKNSLRECKPVFQNIYPGNRSPVYIEIM